MKFILERDKVKREIEAPFEMCASRKDLQALRDLINEVLERDFFYGWITIYEAPEVDTESRTKPLKWTE